MAKKKAEEEPVVPRYGTYPRTGNPHAPEGREPLEEDSGETDSGSSEKDT